MQPTAFRACETCRALKIKCEPTRGSLADGRAVTGNGGESSQSAIADRPPCRRCRDQSISCVYTEPRRAKRKRTDARVRELEREVQKLSELLILRRQAAENQHELPGDSVVDTAPSVGVPTQPTATPTRAAPTPQRPLPQATSPQHASVFDPVSAGIITMDQAVTLFRRFNTAMAPQRPFVVFPPVTLPTQDERTPAIERMIPAIAERVRWETPVLFLSIMTAAMGTGVGAIDGVFEPGTEYEALGMALDSLLLRAYTEKIMYKEQKSIELVQALLISANWNFYYFEYARSRGEGGSSGHAEEEAVPDRFDNLRFFQHLHMAAVMAVELEILRGKAGSGNFGGISSDNPLVFERTLLACYMCCSSISLGFHRQPMLSFTPAMDGYLKRLQTSPNAAPTDAVMVAWVQLQRVVDTTTDMHGLWATIGNVGGSNTCIDHTSLTASYDKIPDITDPSVQCNLKDATHRLEQWREDHSRCMTNSLLMQYNTVMCLLHESCFYGEFDHADLKPPFRLSIPSPPEAFDRPAPLTPAHIASRRVCLMAAQSLIGVFLSAPTEQLLGSPVVVYARVGYSILLLLKLQTSAALPGGAMHGILYDTVTGSSATQIHHYLESAIARMEELTARGGHIASVWLSILQVICEWYEAYFLPAASGLPLPPADSVTGLGPVLVPLRNSPWSPSVRENSRTLGGTRRSPELAEEEPASTAELEVSDIERWMDPRVGLGDIQRQLFEFSGF